MTTKEPINLLRGWPSSSLLPADLLATATAAVLSDKDIYIPALWYGPDPGYEPLRASIAEWLTSFYQSSSGPVTASRLCITGGASQNLGCMLSVYTDPEYTRRIWIVAPAYFLAFRIFEDAGFGVGGKMRAVPEDEEGLDIEFLRREIQRCDEHQGPWPKEPRYKPERARAKVYKHIIYCVPTFANPSSKTMSLRRREELVRLAREHDALIVCDDVYDFLQWPADPESASLDTMKTAHLPRIVDIDRSISGAASDGFGNACSNGSLSKLAGPGIRVGWLEGTEKFAYGVSQTGTTCSGGAPSQLTSTFIHYLLQHGMLQKHISTVLLPTYARRYSIMMKAIQKELTPLGFTLPQSEREVVGGYFCWLALPPSLNAVELARRCKEEENVVVAAGALFEVPGDSERVKFERDIRLCWAWEEEWKLEEGVGRVERVAGKMMREEEDGGGFVVVERGGGVDDFK